ncbi:hypothetical protein VE02_08604 [Pseudogymnoascus sp. 03VT05]|nr:hypothetical protein VE02_08604 [Pseudogymnoascus sp. 03VT05]
MDRRTHEVPMDFEWQTSGPADVTSPFYQLTQKQQGLKRGFESPSKPPPPSSQSAFFSAAPSTTATPFRNPSFTTPRKPFDVDLFSEASGAESSPADNADTEDTPDHPKPSRAPIAMPAFTSTKLDKKPIFGRYGLSALGSPGRDTPRRGKLSDAVAQKARKRRRHDRDPVIHSRRGSIDSGSSSTESHSRRHSPHNSHHSSHSGRQNWFSSLLTGIESRPNLPHLLSYYAQLILNSFLVAVAMYLIYTSIRTIQSDVSKEEARAIDEAHHEIAVCTSHWTTNNCAPHLRVPAVAAACREWEVCMQADPTQVGRAKISAHTFARIVNEFIEPISLKTMLFVVATFLVFGYVNNTAFAAYRSKIDTQPQQQQQQFFHQPPPPSPWPSQQAGEYGWGAIAPPTPRHASGGYGDGNGGPMFAALMPPQTPQRSPRKGGR